MLGPRWEAHVSHARLVAVHSLWVWLGSLYVPFFSSHSLAFCSTCPRQGELLEDGWLFFRTAALFTGKGPSASLVSQLEMGEFSRVRCRNTGDCGLDVPDLGSIASPRVTPPAKAFFRLSLTSVSLPLLCRSWRKRRRLLMRVREV